MKWYQVIFTLLIGVVIGILLSSYWPSPDHSEIEDPIIHQLREEIGWRDFREVRTQDSIRVLRKEKLALANDVIKERRRAEQSEAKLKEHRKEAHPLTTHDTISFLMEDTTLCDQALVDSKKLVAGLTIEVMTDEAIIKNLNSLNSDLRADKKDLIKVDSLHIQKEKNLKKKIRKARLKFLGIGGVLGVVLTLLL